jgi:hypothetical protein
MMTQSPLQLVISSTSHVGKLERKGVSQIVRPKRGDMPRRIALLCIMPAPDVLQDEIECAQGQAPIRERESQYSTPSESATFAQV